MAGGSLLAFPSSVGLRMASLVLLVGALRLHESRGCPFCSAVGNSFVQEMHEATAVVLADLPPGGQINESTLLAKTELQVVHAWKGPVNAKETIEVPLTETLPDGSRYVCFGFGDGEEFTWAYALSLNAEREGYVRTAFRFPLEASERLTFYYRYLESKDSRLSRDAYAEFARTTYKDLRTIKSSFVADELVARIRSSETPPERRRLYWTLLGLCGTEQNAALFDELRACEAADEEFDLGKDAAIAAYLLLQGEAGLERIEREFLRDPAAPYSDTYATVLALRFFCEEVDRFPRQRLLKALRHVLLRPELSDLVIPDLARMQDWSVMEQVAKLFKEAPPDQLFVRVPAVNYLRACPDARAHELLEECRVVDPDAVRRAMVLFK